VARSSQQKVLNGICHPIVELEHLNSLIWIQTVHWYKFSWGLKSWEWDDEFQQKIWNSFGFWAWQQKLWNLRVVVHSFRLFRIHRTQRWIEHVCTPLQKPIHPLFLLFVITPWYIPFFDVLSLADSPVQLAIGTHQPGMLGAIGFNEENYGCTHIHDRKINANAHVYIYI